MSSVTFGERLRRHRVAAGLTQEALAERSGVSVEAISALENGRRRSPRRDTVTMLADGLDLAPEARQELVAAAGRRSRAPERLLLLLAQLVDKNLLRREEDGGQPRVGMLETIREFGRELLEACGEAESVGRAHAEHYRRLVEAAEPGLFGKEQGMWMARIHPIHRHNGDRLALAATLNNLAVIACDMGRFDDGRTWIEESLGLSAEVGDVIGLTGSIHTQGLLAMATGDVDRAAEHFGESLRMRMQLSYLPGYANCIECLGAIARRRGRLERAARLWGAAAGLAGRTGAPSLLWEPERALAEVRAALGESRFRSCWEACLTLTPADAAAEALEESAGGPPA